LPFPNNSLTLFNIVSTSKDSTFITGGLSSGNFASGPHEPPAQPPLVETDPNNPRWGLPVAVFTWLGSVFLLFITQVLIVLPYARYRNPGASGEVLMRFSSTDPTAILLLIISVIPAHLLTIGLIWAVVTDFGKRPFWRAIGWSWSEKLGFWSSAGLAVMLMFMGLVLTKLIGGNPTELDHIVSSSTAARYTTVIIATATAPLVEELIYRGVLYSALQRAIGTLWAVVGVMVLFTVVHVPQYWGNVGVISTIGILSLFLTVVRAWTGRLLPCIIIHTVFNGLSSVLIILEPYMQRDSSGEQKAAAFEIILRAIG
jgi:membrane protease YdiL (CAAX protease family)